MRYENLSQLSTAEIRKLALEGTIFLASEAGLNNLNKKIETVRLEQQSLTLEMGQAANADKDLRENPHFMQTRTRLQSEIPRTIKDLEDEKEKTFLYDEKHITDEVAFGRTFKATVIYPNNENVDETFVLLGSRDVNVGKNNQGPQVISYMSPVGRVVWGAKPGEERDIVFNAKHKDMKGSIKIKELL